jgi:hypothetical protein
MRSPGHCGSRRRVLLACPNTLDRILESCRCAHQRGISRRPQFLPRAGAVSFWHRQLSYAPKCTTPPERNMIARRRWYSYGRLPQMPARLCLPYWELDARLGTKLRQDRLVGRTAGCPAAVWHPGNGRPWSPPCWGRFDGRNENHPAPRLLRGPVRRRLDRQEVRLRRRCPPARVFDEDDQETGLPSRQEFCRQEIYGRSGEAVTIGIFPAPLI